MTAPTVREIVLMLAFSVGLPLAAGAWWRYFSGYDRPNPPAVTIVEQTPAHVTTPGVNEKETDVSRLAWTASPAQEAALPAGSTPSQPEELVER